MYNWKEALWKDVKNIGIMLFAIGGFVAFAQLPDEMWIKQTFAIIFLVVLILLILMFSPLGNPIKRIIRKFQNKKNE